MKPAEVGEGRWTDALAAARAAQPGWAALSVARRLKVLRRLRRLVARNGRELARLATEGAYGGANRKLADSVVGEVLPLADAIKFVERYAGETLRTVRWGNRGRPAWLMGTDVEEVREPHGVVLVIGPGNYPLFLPGVQAVQAVAAGNAVIVKPAPGARGVMEKLCELAREAGAPAGVMACVEEETAAATALIPVVDFVVFTGSERVGRAVLEQAGRAIVPAVVELSGHDAVFVKADADLDLLAGAVLFGLRFNGSATCIAPRRVFVPKDLCERLEAKLRAGVGALAGVAVNEATAERMETLLEDAIGRGARVVAEGEARAGEVRPVVLVDVPEGAKILSEEAFAPVAAVVGVTDEAEALRIAGECPFALGAAVFGGAGADELAKKVNAGTVIVNDVIAPTADPRVPFVGRGRSGFGATRGVEGLLAMTRVKAVVTRRGTFRPYYEQTREGDEEALLSYVTAAHGKGALRRAWAAVKMVRLLAKRGKR